MSAFGRAILDSIQDGPKDFYMTMAQGPSIRMSCSDFLTLRPEEEELLKDLDLMEDCKVLDYGCGAGRYLNFIRKSYPKAHCFGVDTCDLLLEHCQKKITAPAQFASSLIDPPKDGWDLVLLTGNGLGVFGSEHETKKGLEELTKALKPMGRILIETGNPFGGGFSCGTFSLHYKGQTDGPFKWGYSDKKWIRQELSRLNCNVSFQESQAPGGFFFFALGKKKA
jgi:SAM-dependent methyltransferase